MLTIPQAQEYLTSVGIAVPGFILAALVEQANSIAPCMDAAGYDPSTQLLITAYLVGLLALAQGDKYVSSQSAPSGASQSFRYQSFADRWRGTLSLLRGLDKVGCTLDVIPPNPTTTAHGALWVSSGECE